MINKSFVVGLTVMASAIMCVSCPNALYKLSVLLPIVFAVEGFILQSAFRNRSNVVTIGIVGVFLWLRMVLIPLMGANDIDYYKMCTADEMAFYTSLSLIIYESIIVTFATLVFTKNKNRNTISYQVQPILFGNRAVYVLFGLFALVLFLTIGRHLHIYEFAVKTIGQEERAEEELDATVLLIRTIISTGLLFSFFYLIDRFRRKYKRTRNSRYVMFSLLAAMFLVCIIVGERRTSQIYTAFSTCWLLIHVYPFSRKKILRAIILTAVFVLSTMTIYKHFNAFLYDSYTEAINNADFEEGLSANIFDAYFYGVNTIIKNIDFSSVTHLSVFHCCYDAARCTFGLNFFVPRSIGLTSELYNLYLSRGEQTHGYLLSSVGYGYIYLGFAFAPIFSAINVALLSFFEKKMRSSLSIEMTYIWAFVFIRFGFGFLGSFPPLLSVVTRYLFLNGLLYYFAKKIKSR